MRRLSMAIALGVLMLASGARASSWVDPSFEDMVSDASLIAVCEVVDGGTWSCKVKVLDVLKGKKPDGPILVGGYNNAWWPASAIEEQALKTGDKYLLFLSSSDSVHAGFSVSKEDEKAIQAALKEGSITADRAARLRRDARRPKYAAGYTVPTPSTGDYPIKKDFVHGRWLKVSYPSAPVPSAIVLPLVKGLVMQQSGRQPVEARKVLDRHLTVALIRGVKTPEEKREYPKEAVKRYFLFEWLMCAQAAYGDSDKLKEVAAATDHEWYRVRMMAARALRSLREDKGSLALAGKLLGASKSPVQTEAVNSLVKGKFTGKGAGKLVLAALKGSDAQQEGPGGIMDPVRNYSSSGRESMIRAVTHFGLAKEAHDGLVALIREEGLNSGVFDALCTHFLKHPSDKARARFIELARRCPPNTAGYFVDYFFEEGSAASLKEIQSKLLDEKVSAVDRSGWLKRFYSEHGIENPILDETLALLSKQEVDDYFAPGVLAFLIIRNKPEDKDAVARLFRDERLDGHNLSYCFELMRRFQGETEDVEKTLLYLLEKRPDDRSIVQCALLVPSPNVIAKLKAMKNKKTAKTRALVLKAVQLKRRPPASSREQIDAWLGFITQEDVGYVPSALWPELARFTKDEDRKYVAARVRELMKKNEVGALRALPLLSVLDVKLTAEEQKLLSAWRKEPGLGPVPPRDWEGIFRAAKREANRKK